MFIHRKNPFDPDGNETPPEVALGNRKSSRRAALAAIGIAGGGGLVYAGWRWFRGNDAEVVTRGRQSPQALAEQSAFYPASRDLRFEYNRPETEEAAAARYTNFYEFSSTKWCWRYVDRFRTDPWTLTVDGLCRNPLRLDVGELLATFAKEFRERQLRHRCVETWAMAIPWSGIPLASLLKKADPLASATHVRFVSFDESEAAPGMAGMPSAPWPYTEGLTLPEAMNELTFLATGMYGHSLLKQHGAPVRLVVPWKYGYKSIKSIRRIEFVEGQPETFWSTLAPARYPFESNVDPTVARPWSQEFETMLGTNERLPTRLFNGYEEYVASLYL